MPNFYEGRNAFLVEAFVCAQMEKVTSATEFIPIEACSIALLLESYPENW